MTRAVSTRSRVLSFLFAVLLIALAAAWAPISPADAATGPFSGSAYTDIVHAQALNIPDVIELADVGVAPSEVSMNTAGVGGGKNSRGYATNVSADVLSDAIPLDLLVEAESTALPNGPQVQNSIIDELPLDPIANATVSRATAHARWVADGCVPVGTPISTASSELADAKVLTGLGLGDALLTVNNSQGDTVYSDTRTELVNVAGQTGKGVKSTALTQVTGITLFKGSASELTINVLAPPVVTATATGKPGGATVTYSEPILEIVCRW